MDNFNENLLVKPKSSDSQIADFFKVLSHPTRIQILRMLRDQPLCVCEIVPKFQESQASISKHLRLMKDLGVLSFSQHGTRNIYSVSDPEIFTIIDQSRQILKHMFENSLEQIKQIE